MKETIERILKTAVHAPSGHNSQPWKFHINKETLFIYNIPDKDKTLFNYKQRGSFVAHGTLIENITILASKEGYRLDTRLFPKEQESNLVAEIRFEKTDKKYPHEHLAPYIKQRSTNRKRYQLIPLKTKDKEVLEKLSASLKEKNLTITFTEDRNTIHRATGSLSMADKLLFENFHLHKALFSIVNWTLQQEQKKREGLYIGTKELSFLDRFVFKHLLKHWGMVSKLNKIGLSTKAAKKRQKLYEHCSAIGLLSTSGNSPQSFIEAGRALQVFWLTATSLGVSFQPVSAGLLYLGQQTEQETPKEFTKNQIAFVRKAFKDVKEIFNVPQETPAFSFRIGYTTSPTATSLKSPPLYETTKTPLENNEDLSNVGIIFVSPIIGLTQSMMNTWLPLAEKGVHIIGIDIFGDDYAKKTSWKILKFTVFPGGNARIISFANSFPEDKVFDKIEQAIQELARKGKGEIILGGMSGGFIFASRVIQNPSDQELEYHRVRNLKDRVTGLFGISPLVYYPEGMRRPGANLERIPANIPTLLFFGDEDTLIPSGTIEHTAHIANIHKHIQVKILERQKFSNKQKGIKHQFFGGKDFVKPLNNIYWHQEAEQQVIDEIQHFIKIASSNSQTPQ